MRRPPTTTGDHPVGAASPLLTRIAALRRMDVAELRQAYLEAFGEPTRSRNREWLFRSVAWQIQALAEGGLSERARRRAADLARESDVRPRTNPSAPVEAFPGPTRVVGLAPLRDPGRPLPGSVLVRIYKGRELRVRALENGFEYEGQVFRSLTAVAEAVTGAHWSGALFFGLRQPSPGRKAPA